MYSEQDKKYNQEIEIIKYGEIEEQNLAKAQRKVDKARLVAEIHKTHQTRRTKKQKTNNVNNINSNSFIRNCSNKIIYNKYIKQSESKWTNQRKNQYH